MLPGMLLAAVAAVVQWTNPCYLRATEGCGPGLSPLTDLDSVRVVAQVRWNPQPHVVATRSERGRECLPDTMTVPGDSVQTVWIYTKRRANAVWSCASNLAGVNLTLDVQPEPPTQRLEWFDVAGAKLPGVPTRPGWYITRDARGRRKARVIL